jgi:hypothetical protein
MATSSTAAAHIGSGHPLADRIIVGGAYILTVIGSWISEAGMAERQTQRS